DPLVQYCYGAFLQDSNQSEEANEQAAQLIEGSYSGLFELGYPPNRCFAAARRVWQRASGVEGAEEQASEFRGLVREHCLNMILQDEGCNDGRILRTHMHQFTGGLTLEERGKFYEDALAYEEQSPWLVNMIGGKYHKNAAWDARGSGWAADVTDEGWQAFEEHIEQARECYRRAWEANPSRPEAPAAMIGVAMGSSPSAMREMRLWFDRAVQAELNHLHAYTSLLNGMLPRWHGDHDAMYQFGVECASTRRYDTDVPFILCKAVWRICQDDQNPLGNRYWQRPGLYQQVRTICQGYIDREPGPTPYANWWKTVWFGAAYLAGRWDEARELLDEIEMQLDPDALSRFPINGDEAVGAVRLRTGSHSQAALEALELANDGSQPDAMERLAALIEQEDLHPLVRRILHSRWQGLRWNTSFVAGEVVDLVPDEELGAWKETAGNWSVGPDGALHGVSDKQGVILECQASFGSEWELSGVLEYGKSPYAMWDAGVLLYSGEKPLYAVMLNPTEGWVAAGRHNSLDENETAHEFDGKVVSFVVRLQKGVVNVWIDETHVIVDQDLPAWNDGRPMRIALGAAYRWYGSNLKYRELEIRGIDLGE
ncbi:MAG: hypothetical protein AAF961_04580, partial [Planctomycetota bacterium]